MNPHEKYERDLWWLMQRIKLEQLFSVEGEPIDFLLIVEKKSKNASELPNEDSQRKMLHKLQELKVLKLAAHSDPFGSNMFAEPTRFLLTLRKDVFEDVYKTFQTKFGEEQVEEISVKAQPLSKPEMPPVIKERALEWIAEDLSNRHSHTTLTEFFKEIEAPADISLWQAPLFSSW